MIAMTYTEERTETYFRISEKCKETQLLVEMLKVELQTDKQILEIIIPGTNQKLRTCRDTFKDYLEFIQRNDNETGFTTTKKNIEVTEMIDQTTTDVIAENNDIETGFTTREQIIEFYQKGLTKEQSKALDVLVDWYFNNEEDNHALLSGAAGTGKTFTIQRIVKCIQDLCKFEDETFVALNIAMSAPTHYSLSVIEENVEGFNDGVTKKENKLEVYTSTIHSLLHLIVSGDYDWDGNQHLKLNYKSRQPHIDKFNLIVADECSMYDDVLFSHIQKSQSKVIFLGDINQLSPVTKTDESTGRDYIKLSSTFTSVNVKCFLKTPMRFSGKLAEKAFYISENIDSEKYNVPLKTEGNIFVYSDKQQWEDAFHNQLKEEPTSVKAIAWRNIIVNGLNKSAQTHIYGTDIGYHEGQTLLAKSTITKKEQTPYGLKDVIVLHSCQECVVESVDTTLKSFTGALGSKLGIIEVYRLELSTKLTNLVLITPTENSLDKVKKVIREFQKEIETSEYHLRGSKWKAYFQFLNDVCLVAKGKTFLPALQYSASITINQAQGGGFDKVFVDASDIASCRQFKHRNRLLYTAMTRAKKEVHIYNVYGDSEPVENKPKLFMGLWG